MSTVEFQNDLLDPKMLAELDQYISLQSDPQGSIILILHRAQHLMGYLPKELQLYIARRVNLPAAKINGIVTFYSFFVEEPNGKYDIAVCMGTACFVRGADKVLEEFQKQLGLNREKKVSDDGLFSLSDIRCIGACGLAPVVRVNEKIFGHVTAEQVKDIIDRYRKEAAEEAQA